MCIIGFAKTRKMSAAEIDRCWHSNSHGAGLAWWLEDGQTMFSKGFMVFDEFVRMHDRMKPPYVAHFRIATGGSRSPQLTHPFIISKESPLVLSDVGQKIIFHNGIISDWEKMYLGMKMRNEALQGEVMDSRVFAALLHKDISLIKDIPGWSRFAVMDNGFKIDLYSVDIEDDGIFYSNSGYKPWTKPTYHGDHNYSKSNGFWIGNKYYSNWEAYMEENYKYDDHGYEFE